MVVGWTGDCHKALVECILEQSSRRKGAIHVLFLFFHDLAKGEYVDEYFVYCCMQVLDNPKLLKRSLRRDEQQRQKSSKKWKERKAIESKTHQTKQQTRRENITQRQDAKKERQIAKREKKLLRPGFEGRKEGFINT
jgi:Fe2+ transport system protein B